MRERRLLFSSFCCFSGLVILGRSRRRFCCCLCSNFHSKVLALLLQSFAKVVSDKSLDFIFSPIVAIVCFTHSPTVTLSFMMNGCSNNANSLSFLFTRPSTILDRICSGFDKRSSLYISSSVSFFATSSGTSSIEI
jgi:hypothetical protein